MEIFDEVKEKCGELEDQVDVLQLKLKEKDKRIGSLQRELELKNQELLKSSQAPGLNIGQLLQDPSIQQNTSVNNKIVPHHTSTNSGSSDFGAGDQTVLIQRLNAKIG